MLCGPAWLTLRESQLPDSDFDRLVKDTLLDATEDLHPPELRPSRSVHTPRIPTIFAVVLPVILIGAAALTWLATGRPVPQLLSRGPTAAGSPPIAGNPTARSGSALFWDGASNRTIMFGGARDEGTLDDTWSWDGVRWYRLSPTDHPPSRMGAHAAYDPRLRQVVMFGGTHVQATPKCAKPLLERRLNSQGPGIQQGPDPCSGLDQALTDTWIWDGENWHKQRPVHSPTQSAATGPVFDPARNAVEVFDFHGAGQPGTVWTWTGSDWSARSFPSVELDENGAVAARPDARGLLYQQLGVGPTCDASAAGYHGVDGLSYNCMKGQSGYTITTWSWDGDRWSQLLPAQAPGSWVPALATMTADHSIVFADLAPTDGTTWIWRDGDWHPITQTIHPNGRAASLAYDEANREVVLFGGEIGTASDYSAETWIWDGRAWRQN